MARRARALAGPVLIVAGVIAVLHGFLFQGRVSLQHPDVLGFWLPTYCFLGKSLAAGHLPAWNPHVMAGIPFAADPQSGWMYAPAMLLFSALPCGVAIRVMIALQPVLGGLGLYGFLRSERLSRPAATVGGLALALGLAASRLALFLPFPSAFAWTAVLLWACSVTLNAPTWPRRIAWVLVAALIWGQLAAAYFSHGLILGTAAAAVYVATKLWMQARGGARSGRQSLTVAGVMAVSFVAVNLGFLLPRLAYIPETSYGAVVSGPVQLGPQPSPLWPLKLATSPGGYLGILALVLALAAPWSRRHRGLVLAFGTYGVVAYLLGVDGIAPVIARAVEGLPVLDFYAHFPGRFSLGLFLALSILAAVGLDAWLEPRAGPQRALMAAPGVLVFLVLPGVLGAAGWRQLLPILGAVAGAALLIAVARRPGLAAALPALLAVELVTGSLIGQTSGSQGSDRAYADDLFKTATTGWFVPLARPDIDVDAYLRRGPILRALNLYQSRYISLDPAEATSRGYLTLQDPSHWGLMANQRAMLFGLQDAQGYNPIQLERYWSYVRAVTHRPLSYNASIFDDPAPTTLNLLLVRSVVSPDARAQEGWYTVARDGRWSVHRTRNQLFPFSVVSTWVVADGPDASLGAVTAPGFDPERTVVLETDPARWFRGTLDRKEGDSIGPAREPRPQTELVRFTATAQSVVLVRIPYARNWRATVDGEPARILPADHFLMGIPVRRGSHTLVLTYHDPWIGYGLLGSLAAVLGMGVAIVLTGRARSSRRGRHRPGAFSAARSG